MKALLAWLLPRLRQPSTWAGIGTMLGSLLGVAIRPDLWAEITTAGTAIAGAVLVAIDEKKP